MRPSSQPSRQPTSKPSRQPIQQPTAQPSRQPTRQPTAQPSRQPSRRPTLRPSLQPTTQPTAHPTGYGCTSAHLACLACTAQLLYPVCESYGQFSCFFAGGMPPVPAATPMPTIKLAPYRPGNVVLQVTQQVSGLSPQSTNTTAFAAIFEQAVLAIVSPTAQVTNFRIVSITPASTSTVRALLGSVVPTQPENPAGKYVLAVLYQFAAATTNSTGLTGVLRRAVATGQFTSWLQANGYPAASVSQPPSIAVVTPPAAAPAAAPSEPYVWAVGVVVGFVVFVYLFWSGSRRIRMRNKLAKKNLGDDDDDDDADDDDAFYGISGGSSVGDDGVEDDWEEDERRRGSAASKRAARAASRQAAAAAAAYNYDDFEEEDDGTETGAALNVGALGAAAAVAGSRAAALATAAAERQSRINNRFVRPRVFAPEDGDDADAADDDGGGADDGSDRRGLPRAGPTRRSTATIAPPSPADDSVVDDDEIILI